MLSKISRFSGGTDSLETWLHYSTVCPRKHLD
jgi:hypothetical protein